MIIGVESFVQFRVFVDTIGGTVEIYYLKYQVLYRILFHICIYTLYFTFVILDDN